MEKEIKEKNKLYVGGLPYGMQKEDFLEMFLEFGEIKEGFVVSDRGYGFITFVNNESADLALSKLTGTEYEGRALKIDYATPKKK